MNPRFILEETFSHSEFRGLQEEIINRTIESDCGHSLVLMPTGGGKSLCYQVPGLYFNGGTLVISPLISLMKDQVDALLDRGVSAAYINSTVSSAQRQRRLDDFVYGKIKFLYVTPERFSKEDFRFKIKRAKIDLLAVDEAHCISQWGHDFRPDYSNLGEIRLLLGNPRTIALTATATIPVQEDIIRNLNLDSSEMKIFHQGIKRANLRLEAEEYMSDTEKLDEILNIYRSISGSGIVYFSLIKTLNHFSEKLDERKIPHLVYHGKLENSERKKVQNMFMDSQMLILATNSFGMGIDKSDIRYVIHCEIPGSLESYYQEIGRAGRDGKDSLCKMLYSQEDLLTHMEFIKWSNPEPEFLQKVFYLLSNKEREVHSFGRSYVEEQLFYKNRFDFRLDTALSLFERNHVTSGSLIKRNIKILVNQLPEKLLDTELFEQKLKSDQKKLLAIVQYFRSTSCRRGEIERYFGFEDEPDCSNCDTCSF